MRRVISGSLRFRYLVVLAGVAMMVFGFGQVKDMPVDVFPEFAPPRVEVQTACLGLSAAEVESLVTIPVEQALNGLDGVDVMRSKSVEQLSSVELIFTTETDLFKARQLVQERIATVTPTLPTWATPPVMMQPLSATSRTMKIGMASSEMDEIELSSLARWTVRPRLMDVRGVANVAIWGNRQEMLHVMANQDALEANRVSLSQLTTATGDALDAGLLKFLTGSSVGTGGFVETANQRLPLRHVQPIVGPEDLEKVVVAERGGRQLTVSDVATVIRGHQPLIGDAVINDGPGLMLIVEKFPWANTLEVTKGVEEAMSTLNPALAGVEVDTSIFRPATFIETSIGNLSNALLLGCLLVGLVLIGFLYNWRTALISLVSIPLSLMAAALVLYFRDTTLNTMVLAGFVIAVGVVVDDAIIDIENIMRRLREARAKDERSTLTVVLEASLEVRSPIIYATLIAVATLIPVFVIQGLSGSFFRPLAISYALAVLASMAVALTVTPALALIMLRNASLAPRPPWLVRNLQARYQRVLARIIRRPQPAIALVVVSVAAGLLVVPSLGQSLLPSFKERDFLMHWITTPSASHPEMVRISTAASRELRAVPGVRNFGAHIGQALAADEVVGVHFGENWISVDPEADYDTTLQSVQSVVDGYPGLQRDVQTYLKERIREVLTGASEAVVVRVYGPDLETLREKAEEVRAGMKDIPGVIDLSVELQVDIPQIDITVDLAKAQRHSLKPGDVRRSAAILLASEEVNDTYRAGKVFDVRVWSDPSQRDSLQAVRNLRIDTPSGGTVRLSDVADVVIKPTPNLIRREDASRRIDIKANVEGRDLGAVANDVKDSLETVSFSTEYNAEVLGEYAERQAAQRQLLYYSAAAALLVLLLLQTAFRNWRLAILVFLGLPIALVGGALAAFATGGVLSLGSLVGFFTVFGIAARNGILLINHYQHLEEREGVPFGLDLVLRGARERLAPILMTALATGLAVVPLVIRGDIPGHEIEHPMAVVILGGLLTSTLLNLLVVPSMYLRFGRSRVGRDAAISPSPASSPA
jgi:CzcA family heavy metal efflux pump